jgi:hypothetical protein
MFLVLWEYEVKSGCQESFQSAYGPSGDWARLFATDENFVETRLLQDSSATNKFLTLDVWQSRSAYESFKSRNHGAYSAIDKNCERLTNHERHLGNFESPDQQIKSTD